MWRLQLCSAAGGGGCYWHKIKNKRDFKELSREHIDWLKPLNVHYQLKCDDTIGQLVKAAELQRFLFTDSYARDLHLNLEH